MWRRVRRVVGKPPRGLEPGPLLTTQLGWHRALAAMADEALDPADHRLGLGLLRPDLPPRLPPGQLVALLPALPGRDRAVREVVPRRRRGRRDARLEPRAARGHGRDVRPRPRAAVRGPRPPRVLYLVLSPYAFALAMAYSEGLFLALHRVALRALGPRAATWRPCRSRSPPGLTRITGLALVAAAGAAGVAAAHGLGVGALAVAPAGAFAAHAAWLEHAVGDPLAMVHVQAQWGGHPAVPLVSLCRPVLATSRPPTTSSSSPAA